jgi:soluble lytic murein transglycosylase
MMRLLLALFLAWGLTKANVTLEQITSKPPSRATNFLIHQFLKQEITPQEADIAFSRYKDVSKSIFMLYAKKSDDEAVKYTAACWSMNAGKMLKHPDDECALLSLSPYAAVLLNDAQRIELFERFKATKHRPWLEALTDPDMDTKIETYEPDLFLKLFNGTGSKFREAHFNRRYSPEFIASLESSWRFKSMVYTAVLDDDLKKVQLSLLDAPGIHVDAKTAFYLAMNQIRYNQLHDADLLLQTAFEKAYYRMDKDKALFWRYLITQNEEALRDLAASFDINVYSLYAKELLKTPVDNYFSYLKTNSSKPQYDITSPFDWLEILQTIKETPKDELFELATRFQSKPLIAVQAFILERATDYKMHNYIMPYKEEVKDLNNEEKAILYSLMRQESRFIPSALSRSYALGLMQLMPFLVRALDQEFDDERETYFDMFEPEMNLAYAKKHLRWLTNRVYHPLFIAYAYNGGIGFTKRHITQNDTFRKGKYEPFLSMEMMKNSESREYGKKVMANYVIYKKILGEPVSIIRLFETLTQPSQTDRFRK